jgi:hypothetical protein
MSDLSEPEIFDCLKTNFMAAAQHCDDLARLPKKGPTYRKLVACLKLIEGAARQAAYWRQDARWLRIGLMMAEAHKRAGDWLRGMKDEAGARIPLAPGHLHPLFVKLADNLRAGYLLAEAYRTNKTGKVGVILPQPRPAPHRDTRPVSFAGFKTTPSGILIPA